MLVSTQALVLFYKKYNDTSVILHLYTEELGRLPVMVYGVSGKKNKKLAYMQPLFLLDVIIENKPSRQIQVLKEVKTSHPLNGICEDMYKSTQVMFISEVLSKAIGGEHSEPDLFSFLQTSVLMLNELDSGIEHFHTAFLIKLSKYLGFGFLFHKFESNYYDYKIGHFDISKPLHPYFVTEQTHRNIEVFLSKPYYDDYESYMNKEQINTVFATMLKLYDINVSGFRDIKSLQLLREIFEL